MKTSNCKTAQFPRMKRLTMYFSFIVVLCFLNLVAIKAQVSVSENTATNDLPVITTVEEVEPESKFTLSKMIFQSRLFQVISNALRACSETNDNIIQNTSPTLRVIEKREHNILINNDI